jgi:hypothetical protein
MEIAGFSVDKEEHSSRFPSFLEPVSCLLMEHSAGSVGQEVFWEI